MKRLFTLFFVSVIHIAANAQTCTPSWPNGAGAGVQPDSATNLPHANSGTAYSTSINFKVPKDTTYKFGSSNVKAEIDSIVIDSVHGFENISANPAFTYSPNPASGSFKGDSLGCILITGTPLAGSEGSYPLFVYVTAYAHLPTVGNLAVHLPYVITFYKAVVDYPVGVKELATNKFQLLGVQPNPAVQNAALTYYVPAQGKVNLKVYSLLGQLVTDKVLTSPPGLNSYIFETAGIPAGEYFYTMSFKEMKETGRLSVLK